MSTTSQNLAGIHSTEQEILELNQVLPSLSLDETIEQIIKCFGWFQFMQAILVSVSSFFDAQQIFISISTPMQYQNGIALLIQHATQAPIFANSQKVLGLGMNLCTTQS